MSSPKYELIYFDARGRAELTRQIFAAAGVEFKDTRMGGEDWAAFKPETPLGQLPVMKVGSKVIAQSMAVARFAAREVGLAGDGSVDQARVDMITETIMELVAKMMPALYEKDEKKKAELKEQVVGKDAPNVFNQLEKIAGEDYFVGGKLSAADITLHVVIDKNALGIKLTTPRLLKIFSNVRDYG